MMMMVILGALVRIVTGAEFEYMSECRNEEEQQFKEEFLGSAHTEEKRNYK